ncbi:Ig-like domain-containing protein [Paenibacillus hexagrammi]|uniref:Ig-like domain-containing protein n=1 Tax=Paenibacillus hexagrammi TaxID=2908839 RepID=A0ABY3SR63_9BACL|nr:Ig-like domain-containing protein [Paenibacillus sp. YPD9-1]UJF35476.1 Ig-like domain-containing protein [Paenibacillus sp. YPD9-1]
MLFKSRGVRQKKPSSFNNSLTVTAAALTLLCSVQPVVLPGYASTDTGEASTLVSSSSVSAPTDEVNLASSATPSTSYVSSWEKLSAIQDGYDPTSSTDKAGGAYGNWNHSSATEWVEYDWPTPVNINRSDVYWWTDNGGILAPTASKLQYWDGAAFVDVPAAVGNGVALDTYNTTTFLPVTTTKLRMTITRGAQWTGILEWKVYATPTANVKKTKVSTLHGKQPELPAKVTRVLVDGTLMESNVQWDSITSSQLENPGSFTVTGDVEGTNVKAEADVYVRASDEVTLTGISEEQIETYVGKPPQLPAAIEALYSDGSVDNITNQVTWETYDPELLKQPRQFTITGTVEGTSIPAKATITVKPTSIISIAAADVSTIAGNAPVLPSKVTAIYDNGTTASIDVVWEAMDPAQYANAGTFTMKGTVAGTSVEANAIVTVAPKTIVSYQPFSTVYTVTGVAPVMPTSITAVYNDGSTAQVTGVTWPSIPASNYAAEGRFTVNNPTIPGRPSGVARPSATVAVRSINALYDTYVKTEEGNVPQLPNQINAVLSDGSTGLQRAIWETMEPSKYAQAGVFTVNGTVAGTTLPAKAHVTVLTEGAAITGISPAELSTQKGRRSYAA